MESVQLIRRVVNPRYALPWLVALAGALTPIHFVRALAQDELVAIHADHLIDVVQARRIQDAVILVRSGRIEYAGAAASAQPSPAAKRLDLGKVTLLPGFIDAHVHLTLGGPPEANARATVEAGFTTVQDLGAVDTRIYQLRDAVRRGDVVGPRILAAGRWLGVSGGTCDFAGIGVRGESAFRQRVRDEVERGADIIKVCVSGWLSEARRDPQRYEISDAELGAAIDEAHRLGRRVAVHAISERGIDVAVRTGADLLAHGGFVEMATARHMREKNVHMLPTLHSFQQGPGKTDALELERHLRRALDAGLPIALGTDAGVIRHGSNGAEFAWLEKLGLSPANVIRAATVWAATAVGRPETLGTLRVGAEADIIAVDGDPLKDVEALNRVVFVMSRGQVIKARPDHNRAR